MIEAKHLPPPDDLQPLRRALVSVFDKTGIVAFAERLRQHGVEIISTGGTMRTLVDAGIPVTDASAVTSSPEILGGRVKTLHPAIHGGILARRNDPDDRQDLESNHILPIDLVVTNLYPFERAIKDPDVTDALAVENIDIGGPAMIRAAAKNYFFVGVVTDPSDYDRVADELDRHGGRTSLQTRRNLAALAFNRTSDYDRQITAYFQAGSEEDLPEQLSLDYPRVQKLRYGENPHQKAALYGDPFRYFKQLHGKELSFNNLIDLTAALRLIDEFRQSTPTCAILKHTNPCGVGTGTNLEEAYRSAFNTDRQSPFGGIVIVNQELDLETARAIDEIFTEIVIAPSFSASALEHLKRKANRRLILHTKSVSQSSDLDLRSVPGGILAQEPDPPLEVCDALPASWKVVTRRDPTDLELTDLDFAWRVAKHVKSNAIVYARDGATLGIGAGQMSRIDSSEIAVMKAGKSELSLVDCVVASDAFYPFPDGLLAAIQSGARAVIQPGGSIRDEEVIQAADDHDVAMIFTGRRHFRH